MFAFLAVPFVIPGILGLLVHKKMSPSKWKYAILAILVYIGLSSAPRYYANLIHSNIAEPNTVKNQTIGGEVHGAIAPTDIPTPTIVPTEALTPKQTPTPTNTPTSESSATPGTHLRRDTDIPMCDRN